MVSVTLEALLAETIGIAGYDGDMIDAYYARPLTTSPAPSVLVLHHMPGWDDWTREATRKLAAQGYATLAPHLFHRLGPGPGKSSRRRTEPSAVRQMRRHSATSRVLPGSCWASPRRMGSWESWACPLEADWRFWRRRGCRASRLPSTVGVGVSHHDRTS